MTHKIILDTDPGIDDAMAILFAEAHPAIDLLAITTVFGNATIENGTRNALWLKTKYGMKADVARRRRAAARARGADNGGARPERLWRRPGGEVTLIPDPRPAWQYVVETVKAHPGEITLGPSGPSHQPGAGARGGPEVAALVKEVVVMGGAFGVKRPSRQRDPHAEANIHDDPDAADRVFTAPKSLVIIGLDVTQQSIFTADYLDALRDDAGEPAASCGMSASFYLRFYSERIGMAGCHVHDPSAIAYVIDPALFTPAQGAGAGHHRGARIGIPCKSLTTPAIPHDEWAHCPAQQVGVAVRDQSARPYQDTLVAWGRGRR